MTLLGTLHNRSHDQRMLSFSLGQSFPLHNLRDQTPVQLIALVFHVYLHSQHSMEESSVTACTKTFLKTILRVCSALSHFRNIASRLCKQERKQNGLLEKQGLFDVQAEQYQAHASLHNRSYATLRTSTGHGPADRVGRDVGQVNKYIAHIIKRLGDQGCRMQAESC